MLEVLDFSPASMEGGAAPGIRFGQDRTADRGTMAEVSILALQQIGR